jgi:hypothetical protein
MKRIGSIGTVTIIIGELIYKRYGRSKLRIWLGVPRLGL